MGIFNTKLFRFFGFKQKPNAPWNKYYNKEDMDLKIPNTSLYQYFLDSIQNHSNLNAIDYYGTKITYKQLSDKIDDCANSFLSYGIRKNDVVTICMPNTPEGIIAFFALNKIGAISNMVHPLSSEEEILFSLNSTKSKYLVMLNTFYNKIENVIGKSSVDAVIFASAADYMPIYMKLFYNLSQIGKYKKYPKNNMYYSWKKFYKKYYVTNHIKFPKFCKDTPAVIIHSGGTSGTPKNFVIQNRAFILGALQ